jgi:hypothetical protein
MWENQAPTARARHITYVRLSFLAIIYSILKLYAWPGTLFGVYSYILYTSDFEWLSGIWSKYTLGVQYIASKVDSSGLANFTSGSEDWGRQGMGGYNSEGNAIYYQVSTHVYILLNKSLTEYTRFLSQAHYLLTGTTTPL